MKGIRRTLSLIACIICITLFLGCMLAPVVPPAGIIYSNTKAPLDIDVNNTTIGSKRGEASCLNIMMLVAFGDASINEAARNGGIKTVKHVDYEFTNIFGLYQEYKTIVYGE